MKQVNANKSRDCHNRRRNQRKMASCGDCNLIPALMVAQAPGWVHKRLHKVLDKNDPWKISSGAIVM